MNTDAHGPTGDTVTAYTKTTHGLSRVANLKDHRGRPRGTEPIMVRALLSSHDVGPENEGAALRMGQGIEVSVEFERDSSPFRPVLGVAVSNYLGVPVFCVDNRFIAGFLFEPQDRGTITCIIPKLSLMPGLYSIELFLGDSQRSLDRVADALSFEIVASDVYGTGRLPGRGRKWLTFEQAEWNLTKDFLSDGDDPAHLRGSA